MGFLNPLFLGAAAVVAVPILLHLLHRRSGRRRAFPALRYLRRTEREHARRIRLRQILLLLLRAAAVLLLVAAGARLVLAGRGAEHPPTAVAVVLDNTLSTGVVADGERLLDDLKRAALEALEGASAEDRVWVVRAGEPWETPRPVAPDEARRLVEETEPRGAGPSLLPALRRARSLVADADLPAAEVHVLTDLQAGVFEAVAASADGTEDVPVLVFAPPGTPPPNRYVASVDVGGGLPPLLDQPTEVTARVDASVPADADGADDSVRVRLVVDGRTAAVADAPLGATVVLPAGPFSSSAITGAVEIDPDALRSDDRHHLAFPVRSPPAVAVIGEPGRFVREALTVLADAGRLRSSPPGRADVSLVVGGEADTTGAGGADGALIVLPPVDPSLLPAANRRLEALGVPWRFESEAAPGETGLESVNVPVDLEDVRVRGGYRLAPESEDGGSVRVRRSDGTPWIVTGTTEEGRPHLLVGSPLQPDRTSLPLSAEMLPLVEWIVSGWPPGFGVRGSVPVGDPLPVPPSADAVRAPDGTLHPVDGSGVFRATGLPGIYSVLAGDSVLERTAVNPPPGESRLERLEPEEALRRISGPAEAVSDADEWASRVFVERRGHEPWRPLLLAALLLLLTEGWIAAGGGSAAREKKRRNEPTETTRAGAT